MKRFRFDDLKMGKKLIISYGAIIILYVFTIITALFGVSKTSQTLDIFYQKAFMVAYTAMDMKASVQGIGRCILDVATGVSEEVRQKNFQKIEEQVQVLQSGLPVLKTGMVGEELVNEFETYMVEVQPIRKKIMQMLEQERYREALDIFDNQYEPYVRNARDCLERISDKSIERAERYLKDGYAVKKRMNTTLLFLGAAVLAVTVWLGVRISRSITRPVKEIKDAAEQLAEGNLDVTVTYRSGDELGGLADSVRETAVALKSYVSELERGLYAIGSGRLTYQSEVDFKGDFAAVEQSMTQITKLLNRALLQIANTADQVADGSDQVAGGAQIMSQGAVEQAGAMEELAANINEISDDVRHNADDALKASTLVNQVNDMVVASSHRMENMLLAVGKIRENSTSIRNIVQQVEDIAFQTNLLALNAAVEAARAGEAGRAFSVVASEIRALSAKTAEASKMMAELSSRTEVTVGDGISTAEQTSKALEKVVEGTEEIIAMVGRISQASVRQSDSVIQIRQSIEQVSEIVQGNSATAEEGAAASEELSAQAQTLKKLVEGFELS